MTKYKNTPKKIYLNISDDETLEDEVDFESLDGITWSQDKINKNDIEYVLNNDESLFWLIRKRQSELNQEEKKLRYEEKDIYAADLCSHVNWELQKIIEKFDKTY